MVWADATNDVLVLGATGFVGRLITRYLCSHRQRKLFRLALAARSEEKLKKLVEEENVGEKVDELVTVDVTDPASVERAVRKARVVINAVGPYWLYGTPVVEACVRNQVHYVDLTGETGWIKKIIQEYDYAATRNHTIIVPSCGYDSVPSDIVVWLANATLKRWDTKYPRPGQQYLGIKSSVSAHNPVGGLSGGTFNSMFTMFDTNVTPPEVLRESSVPYSISPVRGGKQFERRLTYELPPAPSMERVVGGYWGMRDTNVWLVQRTFGLYEALANETEASAASTEESLKRVNALRYGPNFVYDEFMVTSNKLSGFIISVILVAVMTLARSSAIFRWLMKKVVPAPGEGPSEESMKKGSLSVMNVTTSDSEPPVKVQSSMTGKGDPGYSLTAVMISECALSLLIGPHDDAAPSSESTDARRLTSFARDGGVLTPMTAFGEDLITRLCETKLFKFSSMIVLDDALKALIKKDKDV